MNSLLMCWKVRWCNNSDLYTHWLNERIYTACRRILPIKITLRLWEAVQLCDRLRNVCDCHLILLLLKLGPVGTTPLALQPSRPFVYLSPFLVPKFITRGAPGRTIWETSVSEGRKDGRETAGQIFPDNVTFTKLLGSLTCRKSATWDRRLYFPPKEGMLRIFTPEKSDAFSWVWTGELGYKKAAC
jgi:hypothetical protein